MNGFMICPDYLDARRPRVDRQHRARPEWSVKRLATRHVRLGKADQVAGEESRTCSDTESLHIPLYVPA